ncbi:MAG: hypothetical protein RMJ07_06650 [Nitrososphaerota archaeon]|nr:hypothetical protein [Candidatus Bathyarchaeota archaeon]MDW8049334.1 hypothetical protein [Nitrososphaerota archaeon]
MMGGKEKPFIIRVFGRHIQNYTLTSGGTILADPKPPSFIHGLAFRQSVVGIFGFGETKWHIIGIHEMFKKSEMNDESVKLYRMLKGMECVIEVKGILRKEVVFKPHPDLDRLKKYIPMLEISERLCNILKQKMRVVDLIKSINPSDLSICLYSGQVGTETLSETDTANASIYQKIAAYYENPDRVTWLVNLSTLFQEMPFIEKKANSIIQLFNEIFRTVGEEFQPKKGN